MGLFGKKNKKEEIKKGFSRIPELPELPKLPELPYMEESSYENSSLPQLPKFPNNSLGDKFSQNTIKEAIAGKKESEEVFDAEDFPEEDEEISGMMQKPLQKSFRENFENYEKGISTKFKSKEIPQNFVTRNYMTKKAEPIFIRIDKFEESMKIFQGIRSQVSEIENLMRDIKEIKSKEDGELASWENEIQIIKNQIEKVDQDIFSRIE